MIQTGKVKVHSQTQGTAILLALLIWGRWDSEQQDNFEKKLHWDSSSKM